jgi:hypothetical protein
MGVRGRSPVRDYILILIGASIMGFAIKNIYDPMGLVTGGASGVAIILKKQFGVPLWLTNTAINVPLFAAAARLKGWKFIRRTLVATVALSVSLYVIPEIPFLMDDLFLTALFGGIITGAGAGIVFACQATTGGTDMLQRKAKIPNISPRKIIQSHVCHAFLIPKFHITQIPCNGKHPGKRFPLWLIASGRGPDFQIGLLQNLFCILRIFQDRQNKAVDTPARLQIKLVKGFPVTKCYLFQKFFVVQSALPSLSLMQILPISDVLPADNCFQP